MVDQELDLSPASAGYLWLDCDLNPIMDRPPCLVSNSHIAYLSESHGILAGIYLAIFSLAIYSFSLSKATSTSSAQTRIQLIIVVTSVSNTNVVHGIIYHFTFRGIMLAFKTAINVLGLSPLLCFSLRTAGFSFCYSSSITIVIPHILTYLNM
jgi:hypothetical protein